MAAHRQRSAVSLQSLHTQRAFPDGVSSSPLRRSSLSLLTGESTTNVVPYPHDHVDSTAPLCECQSASASSDSDLSDGECSVLLRTVPHTRTRGRQSPKMSVDASVMYRVKKRVSEGAVHAPRMLRHGSKLSLGTPTQRTHVGSDLCEDESRVLAHTVHMPKQSSAMSFDASTLYRPKSATEGAVHAPRMFRQHSKLNIGTSAKCTHGGTNRVESAQANARRRHRSATDNPSLTERMCRSASDFHVRAQATAAEVPTKCAPVFRRFKTGSNSTGVCRTQLEDIPTSAGELNIA